MLFRSAGSDDSDTAASVASLSAFQSTLPSRGATVKAFNDGELTHFNPRSPRGERPVGVRGETCRKAISIHAPLAGSDVDNVIGVLFDEISIHAPLAGSDKNEVKNTGSEKIISIHAPLAGSDEWAVHV